MAASIPAAIAPIEPKKRIPEKKWVKVSWLIWLIELAPGYILDVDAQGVAAQLRFRGGGAGWDKHDRDQAAPLGWHRFFSLAVARGFGPIDLPGVLTGRQDIIDLDRDNLILSAYVGTRFFGRTVERVDSA